MNFLQDFMLFFRGAAVFHVHPVQVATIFAHLYEQCMLGVDHFMEHSVCEDVCFVLEVSALVDICEIF